MVVCVHTCPSDNIRHLSHACLPLLDFQGQHLVLICFSHEERWRFKAPLGVLRGGHEPVAGGSDGDTVKENATKEMIILPPGHLFLHLLPFQSGTVPSSFHLSLSPSSYKATYSIGLRPYPYDLI